MPINDAALEHFLSWEGPVGRNIISGRIYPFIEVARTNAPYDPENPGPHLAESIDAAFSEEPGALIARIGTNPHRSKRGYAWIVHQGSRPHPITANPPRKSLRFKVGGRIVFAYRVAHPGTHPDPFLTRWIKELTR